MEAVHSAADDLSLPTPYPSCVWSDTHTEYPACRRFTLASIAGQSHVVGAHGPLHPVGLDGLCGRPWGAPHRFEPLQRAAQEGQKRTRLPSAYGGHQTPLARLGGATRRATRCARRRSPAAAHGGKAAGDSRIEMGSYHRPSRGAG